MTKLDRVALELALKTVLEGKDDVRAAQVYAMLREDGWDYAAKFCSVHLQSQQLQLRPWDVPPCRLTQPDDSEAGRVLSRMLDAGMSRYAPNPLAVLK
jgi:hypothetical protein